MTVRAVYQGGVFHPAEPVALPEGTEVAMDFAPVPPTAEPLGDAEGARRIRAATSMEEVFALANRLAPPEDGYDLCAALNENRRAAGERLVYSELADEVPK